MILTQMNPLELFPSILKYGVTGLSAIVLLLAFYLLQVQNKRKNPSSSMLKTIKSYMRIALIFGIISAISSFVEAYLVNNVKVSESREETLIYNVTDNLSSQIKYIRHRYKFDDGRMVKGGINDGDENARNEDMSKSEYSYRVLKFAVFKSIRSFGADEEILKTSLESIKGLYGFGDSGTRVISELDSILGLRYRWLIDAERQVQSHIDNISISNQSFDQGVKIPIPKEMWLFTTYDEDNVPTITVNRQQLKGFEEESELIRKKI